MPTRRQGRTDDSPMYKSILTIDITDSGRWGQNLAQRHARDALDEMVRDSLLAAGVPKQSRSISDRGDGMTVIVAATVSTVVLLDPLIPFLTGALRKHNAIADKQYRIRVRVALHAGNVLHDSNGWFGVELILANRLVDCTAVHKRQGPDDDLVLVVSEGVFNQIVEQRFRNINPETYQRIEVMEKELEVCAWVHVPPA